jgi:transposase
MKNIELCQHIPEQFRPEFANMHNTISEMAEEINRLRRKLFGPSAESRPVSPMIDPRGTLFNEPEDIIGKLDLKPENLQLQEDKSPESPDQKPSKKTPRSSESGGRKSFPEDIERVVTICDLPNEQKICPVDGSTLVEIGREIVEKIDVIPSKVVINQYVYLKYGCPECENTIKKAEALPSVIPNASCDSGMLIFVTIQKYLYGIPLYRIEQMFSQAAFDVSRTSMARWVIQTADFLGDLAFEIKKYILSQSALHADETTVQVLKEPGKKAESKSYMWVICSPEHAHPAVFFQYETSREGRCAKDLLQKYSGLVHVDGYPGYNSAISENKATRVGCWAHVRRKFEVAEKDGAKDGKSLAGEFLNQMQKLFSIERDLKDCDFEKITEYRQNKSSPIVDKIFEKMESNRNKIPPKSKLGLAMTYLANERQHLIVFLSHPNASISNNRVENHIRPFAIGRKNWLFSDTQKGATSSAIHYTIFSSAKANNLSVEKYLRKLFSLLPEIYATQKTRINLEPFLPWNCQDCSNLPKN